MNIDLNCFDDAKLNTLFYTAKCFSDYFQKSAFSLFLAQTCSNSLYNLSMINIIYPGIDMLKLC